MAFHARFEINIVDALSSQLLQALEALVPAATLDEVHIGQVEVEQGVYVLYHQTTLAYVGKASNLRARLTDHHQKLGGRHNIQLVDMTFKCLYVHQNWTALAPENALIKYFKAQNAGFCAWNGNSFGPHDPGRNREITNKATDGFDTQYPIMDMIPCTWIDAGTWNVRQLLIELKENLPFLLRYETETHYRTGHPGYNNVSLDVPLPAMPARDLLRLIARALPGWQATVFPSHMILYEETRPYDFGQIL